jgi:hypothetical protein
MPLKTIAALFFALAALLTTNSAPSNAQGEEARYGKLLQIYVSPSESDINLVDYAAWQENEADRKALGNYLVYLQKQKPSAMKREDAFVFWINLYNAATLKAVLDNYPVDSIRDIKSEGASLLDFKAFFGPWRTKLTTIEGVKHSLDDIEHNVIRPQFKDPRSHYALNCASIGCPNIKRTPWKTATLEADLDAAAAAFINHPRGVKVGPDGALNVSSIYVWFEDDFGGSEDGVIAHFRKYAGPRLAKKLEGNVRIARDHYEWALNERLSAQAAVH